VTTTPDKSALAQARERLSEFESGARGPYSNIASDLRLVLDALADAERVNVKLIEYVKGAAYCPCCEQYDECLDGCTFVKDDGDAACAMEHARSLLKDSQ